MKMDEFYSFSMIYLKDVQMVRVNFRTVLATGKIFVQRLKRRD
jgi:hypothetical protein